MEQLAELHPIIVHFVIALGFVGIGLRVVSLLPIAAWTRPAASALLIAAAVAALLAAKSGEEAHGPAERIPGAREAVKEHEETGEQARNALAVVGLLEIGALALRKREKLAKGLLIASAVFGIGAGYFIFEAGEHGGELVYEYAGGVGTRSGDAEDVQRLLVAGLYHQARVARDAGHKDEAARLTAELARQRPDDPMVSLLHVESQLKDVDDAPGAMAALQTLTGPADQPAFAVRRGVLLAETYAATGQADSARAVLTALQGQFPDSRMVKSAMEKLK